MSNIKTFAELVIKVEESYRSKPYYCSEQFPTIGYGRVVGKKGEPLPNISITKQEATKDLVNRIINIQNSLIKSFPIAWNNCTEQRQAILISMTYQLGLAGVSNFKKMWKALESGNFELASKEMLDSKWAKQTPKRALRHSEQMRNGDMLLYYLTNKDLY